jgi:hypothetical protein
MPITSRASLPRRFGVAAAFVAAAAAASSAATATPVSAIFESAGANAAAITPTRDAFRSAIGGGNVAGANGSFGGVRREINWDGVPNALADPALLPGNFFNTNSPRGAVFTTPGTGFLVSSNAGSAAPVLFGFGNDFAAFSAQRLFTAVNSNTTDVYFFVAGTNTAATTSAFGAIFTDVETTDSSRIDFFDETGALFLTRSVLTSGNQGLSFLGAQVTGGGISRVRITSGINTISANGVIANQEDVVVMDDFIFAEAAALPEPTSLALAGLALAGLLAVQRRQASHH